MDWGLIIFGVSALLCAALIYPGELSQFSPRANRWLYNRFAQNYQDKWRSAAYEDHSHQDRIIGHVRDSITACGINSVLDLGCGTGRVIRLTGDILDAESRYTGVDYSGEMLAQFQAWLDTEGKAMSSRVRLVQAELGEWALQPERFEYGAVFLLEVGELLPAFEQVIRRLASLVPPGGGLVMTRPAHFWWLFFPTRKQSRGALAQLLESAGFDRPEFISWRFRYEILLSKKSTN